MTMVSLSDHDVFRSAIQGSDLFLAYFSSPDCGVCSSIRPKVEALLEDHPSVKSCYVDISADQELAAQENVFTIPAILLFVRGKETFRWARNFGILEIEEKIERFEGLMDIG